MNKQLQIIGTIVIVISIIYQALNSDWNNLPLTLGDIQNIENSQLQFNLETKVINAETLVFVTPWNLKGYSYTLKYPSKFDYISPVWYTMKDYKNIEGSANIDWHQTIKELNPNVLVTPRLSIEGQQDKLIQLIDHDDDAIKTIKKIFAQYDGIVIDCPMISYIDAAKFYKLLEFLEKLIVALKENDKQFKVITTIYGLNESQKQKKKTLNRLHKISDKILVQTYDYQNSQVLPYQLLSPVDWFNKNIDYFKPYNKVMLVLYIIIQGIPFYGFRKSKHQLKHIVGHEFMALNNDDYSAKWDDKSKECIYSSYFEQITYPCMKFIEERIKLIELNGLGVFVWELGQGLEQFMQLF